MQKFLYTFLAAFLFGSAVHAQQNAPADAPKDLTLTVDLSWLKSPISKLYFTYYNTTTKFRYTDSVEPGNNKKVIFKTTLNEPILAQLRAVPVTNQVAAGPRVYSAKDNYSLYIEPGNISAVAVDSLSNTTVSGSKTHNTYLSLKASEKPYDLQLESLYQLYGEAGKNKDSSLQKTSSKSRFLVGGKKDKVYKQFVLTKGKSSPVGLYALGQYTGYAIDPVKAQPLYDQLDPTIKALPAGKAFAQRIETARHLQVGQKAFDFTQRDTVDNIVSLASFRGKYVLIDFWASWCGPCRAENPNVVKAFNKYKDKGFTVLGVSLDRPGQKDRWLKAIHDDGLAWTQVSDLKFWDNEVAALYDIKAIPQNFLIDKEGRIIAKNVRGEELEATLQEQIK